MSLNLELKYILLSLVILVVGLTPLAKTFRGIFTQVSAPFLYGFVNIARATHNEWSFWVNLREMQQKNTILEEKIAELSKKIVTMSELTNENDLLSGTLGIKEIVPSLNPVLVTILGFSQGKGFDHGFIVNAGSNQGIRIGNVVTYKDVLVGIIVEVTPHSAIVGPTISPSLKIAAKIARTGAFGVVFGDFGTQLKITGLLPTDDVVTGDIVSTSALSKDVPAGLLLGFVDTVLVAPQAIQKEASIKMPLDLATLEKIIVWTQP